MYTKVHSTSGRVNYIPLQSNSHDTRRAKSHKITERHTTFASNDFCRRKKTTRRVVINTGLNPFTGRAGHITGRAPGSTLGSSAFPLCPCAILHATTSKYRRRCPARGGRFGRVYFSTNARSITYSWGIPARVSLNPHSSRIPVRSLSIAGEPHNIKRSSSTFG